MDEHTLKPELTLDGGNASAAPVLVLDGGSAAPPARKPTEAVPVQPTQNQGPESAAPQGERDENEDTDAE